MKAKEFEEHCLYRMQQEEKLGRAMMVRYGVQGAYRKGEPLNTDKYVKMMTAGGLSAYVAMGVVDELVNAVKASANEWQPIRSLPDFVGILKGGRAFDIEAKVCGSASFSLHDEKLKKRQLAYLLKRASFGSIAILLLHFSERKLATRLDEPQTWAFPVHPEHAFWEGFERGEVRSISRSDCEEYAAFVAWNCLPGGRTPRPDILSAVYELAARMKRETALAR